MNALVGQEAKANFALFLPIRSKGADDGRREDASDFSSTGGGLHPRGIWKFEVLHDGSRESKPSVMVREAVRNGWQRIAMRLYLANLVSQE